MTDKDKLNLILAQILSEFKVDENYNILGIKPAMIVRNKINELEEAEAAKLVEKLRAILNE